MGGMRNLLPLLVVALVGCSAADGSEADALSGANMPLRFDVATILETPGAGAYASFNDTDKDHCAPVVVPSFSGDGTKHEKCLREAEWAALNYTTQHHWIAMPSDSHRSTIRAAGNDLAAYVDRLNAGYTGSGNGTQAGLAAADAAWSAMQSSYGNDVPTWIILNEISSAWSSSQVYRDYVVGYAARLAGAHQRKVIVCSQFPTVSMNHAADWKKLSGVAYIGVEVQVRGSDVVADPSAALKKFGAAMTTYTNTGVPKAKVMLVDNYSNTPPGWAFGRNGVSADDWRMAIKKRTAAAVKVGFGGYISYAWDGNNGESDSATRQSFTSAYSGQASGNPGSGGSTNPPPPAPTNNPPPPSNPPPSNPPGCGGLGSGQALGQPGSVKSCDGRFNLDVQSDGNVVLYFLGNGPLWATHTSGGGHTLAMQSDGNLVLYDAASKPVWSSGTYGHPGATLAVQNDGNLVVYQGTTPLWASNTSGH